MSFARESKTRNPDADPTRMRFDWTRAALRRDDFAQQPRPSPSGTTRAEIPYGPKKRKKSNKKKSDKTKPATEKRGKPGVADLYIVVRTPAKITAKDVMETKPLLAPLSGISFQLARHATFKQDESVMARLRWTSPGARIPPAKQPETNAHFKHSWTSKTENRPDLPGNPIMLEDFDTHIYGLSVRPGIDCEKAAMKGSPRFDRKTSDWTFVEDGQFIDTVKFARKTIKRTYYFHYESSKKGSTVTANVRYTNVDKVIKV